jgi:hypothetical protein
MHSSIRYFKKARSDPFGSDVSGVVGFRRTFSRLLGITEKREEMSKNQEERKKVKDQRRKFYLVHNCDFWKTICKRFAREMLVFGGYQGRNIVGTMWSVDVQKKMVKM